MLKHGPTFLKKRTLRVHRKGRGGVCFYKAPLLRLKVRSVANQRMVFPIER